MATHTATDIVTLIRATRNGEFTLSGSEAELLVNLFASVAATASNNVIRIGDHTPEPRRTAAGHAQAHDALAMILGRSR